MYLKKFIKIILLNISFVSFGLNEFNKNVYCESENLIEKESLSSIEERKPSSEILLRREVFLKKLKKIPLKVLIPPKRSRKKTNLSLSLKINKFVNLFLTIF